MILILSNKWDVTVDFVVRELRLRKRNFLRLNTEDLMNEKCNLSLMPLNITVTKNGVTYNLSKDVTVIWNRRPGRPYDDILKSQRPTEAVVHFVTDQWYAWLEALQLLPNVLWINHPHANGRMENKIRQLCAAQKMGFSIPDTLISNDPSRIRGHYKKNKERFVAKALYAPLIEEPDQDYFIFSNLIEDLADDCDLELQTAPSIYQEPMIPKVDYRVTVIADSVFAVKISNCSGGNFFDWRVQKDGLRFEKADLPLDIEQMCRDYVKESDLVFGAIDLVEVGNQFVFLEINPNGEWGWLQKPHGVPIAEALCDQMVKFDKQGRADGIRA